jgi:antitoxin HigA-1
MNGKYLPVPHPGEILLEDYLKPMGISQNRLALAMRVPPNRISEIVNGKRSISAETALRIGRALGTSGELWLGLQMEYDIRVAKQITSKIIEQEVIPIY